MTTLEHFRDNGLDLHLLDLGRSVINSGVSELIFTILVAAAKFERHRIKERIQDNKTDPRERGLFLGGARPFGWQRSDDGHLVEDAVEQAARAQFLDLRAGGTSLRAISGLLAENGISLSHVGVGRVIEAERARTAASA